MDFKPGDIVRGELNPGYHVANRPFFDTIEMKGGGDAVSAARAVLQTGEYDYAWNMQVEDDILQAAGAGRQGPGRDLARRQHRAHPVQPHRPVDRGRRRAVERSRPSTRLLTDPAVRQALNLLVDRAAVQEQIYGRLGQTSANFLNAPSRFRSQNTKWEFNVDKANQILDAAGWKRGADGIRAKDGKRLKILFQTSINAPRQKTQAIVKQAAAKAGIEIELKSVVASVFFSSDAANPTPTRTSTPTSRCTRRPWARPTRSSFMSAVHLLGGRHQGQQVAGPQHHPLAQRGVRPRSGRPPRPRWTRSSAPRSSSR